MGIAPLAVRKYHPLGVTNLFVQSGSMPFPRIFFSVLSLLLTDGDIGVSLGEPSWFWHSCHLAHDK